LIIKSRVCFALRGRGENVYHSSQKLSSTSFPLLREHCFSINKRLMCQIIDFDNQESELLINSELNIKDAYNTDR